MFETSFTKATIRKLREPQIMAPKGARAINKSHVNDQLSMFLSGMGLSDDLLSKAQAVSTCQNDFEGLKPDSMLSDQQKQLAECMRNMVEDPATYGELLSLDKQSNNNTTSCSSS